MGNIANPAADGWEDERAENDKVYLPESPPDNAPHADGGAVVGRVRLRHARREVRPGRQAQRA